VPVRPVIGLTLSRSGDRMSFDLYLLPLQQTDDFDTAMSLLDALGRKDPEYAYELDAREAAQAILQLDPRYQPFKKDFVAIAKYEQITEEEARLRHDSVELNGTADDGQPLAQLHFHRYHIVIHCYSGTSADELDRYVIALCAATGLAAVDPQAGNVWRLQEDGTLA
jgi:hypothetical protein